jgi:biopolymer transport protein ExbB
MLDFRDLARRLSTKLSTVAVDDPGRPGPTCELLPACRESASKEAPVQGHNPRAAELTASEGLPQERARLLSIIQAAGWPIWPLLICSIAALALVIERLMNLRTVRVAPPRLLDEVISVTRAHLPAPDVIAKLADNSVLGTVLAAGLRAVIADPRITEVALRNAFESAGRAAVHRLERYLNTLGTIASAAPLLGLFGTVVGMIEIFGSQAPTGGSNPALLAHGISVALYNTAFGLIIAVPALMFYRYFRGRVDEFTIDLEQASERLVPHLLRFAVTRTAH